MAETLSVVIPCYNEVHTLERIVQRLLALRSGGLPLQIIIVDDGSTDGSYEVANKLARFHFEITVLRNEHNSGKGASLRLGFSKTTGDFVVVQDADLEYHPEDLPALMKLLSDGEADFVIGSRYLNNQVRPTQRFMHRQANRVITLLLNMLGGCRLSDVESCYKMFRRKLLDQLSLVENGFGFDPELVLKASKLQLDGRPVRIREAPIRYTPRSYAEGKKIVFTDAIRAIYCIFRYSFK